ncbi:hypothetical protein [Algicella marina]|uniref:SGNH/GDSL hydrolase family protein n=1 Tax=Algicella marina TaxID=2683284 RepID=A0A6P1T821_9RHOB|nr:hypothetical protein [Algicella marina]QHQ36742.1 hypothetical protein GO499_16955 [Algicella marina]
MKLPRLISLIFVGGVLLVLGWDMVRDELMPADRKILFVGNSFLFVGDVPQQVKRLAASGPEPVRYHTRMIAEPNHRLAWHVEDGKALSELRSGVWDTVVLQDYSRTVFSPDLKAEMERSVEILTQAAEAAGTEVVFYAHWPPAPITRADRAAKVAQIERTYRHIASRTGGRVAPVGRAFAEAWDRGIAGLISVDGHHASLLGSHVAALVVLATLGDVSPDETNWRPEGLTEEMVAALKRDSSRYFRADFAQNR